MNMKKQLLNIFKNEIERISADFRIKRLEIW